MIKRIPLPSQEYLKECFEYNPNTGVLKWKERPRKHFKTEPAWKGWNTRYAGTSSKSANGSGYLVVCIDSKNYLVHRVIWKLILNKEPEYLDHKNGITTDNKFDNLREADEFQTVWNRKLKRISRTGRKGVSYDKRVQKWRADIRACGKVMHLGQFKTLKEASDAYENAAIKYHGDFLRQE